MTSSIVHFHFSVSLPFPPTILICFCSFTHLPPNFPPSPLLPPQNAAPLSALSAWLLAQGHTWCTGGPFFFFFFPFRGPKQNPLHTQMRFDCACLCRTVCFQMNSWENSVAFCPTYIPVSLPTATTTILPSRSIISILSFSVFLSLCFWLALWTKHGARCHCKTCLLPSQVLSVCSSAPLRAPQPFSSVQLLCSLQKGLHPALVFFEPTPHNQPTPPFLLFPPSSLPPSFPSE